MKSLSNQYTAIRFFHKQINISSKNSKSIKEEYSFKSTHKHPIYQTTIRHRSVN